MNVWLAETWRAWRAMLRRPGFLLLAGGVLALGIGATVAVFVLIQNSLWRPLPVPHASRLVMIGTIAENGRIDGISPHEFQSLGKLDGVVSMGLERPGSTVNVAGAGAPAQVPVIYLDRQVLPTLGIAPVLGRNFTAVEDAPHGPAAVLIGYGFWQRRYNGDRHVVGMQLTVKGVPHTIVGVLPAALNTVLGPGDVALPMALPLVSRDYNRNGHTAIARMAPVPRSPRCRRKPMRASERCTATWAWAATGRSRATARKAWLPPCSRTHGRCCCCSAPVRRWCC